MTLALLLAKAPSALDPKGPAARDLAHVFWLMVGIATVIYVVTMGLFVFGLFRKGERPTRFTDHAFIVAGGLVVPSAVVLLLAVVTIHTTHRLTRSEPNALQVEVTGYQYWWAVKYPAQRAVTANEIHIPVGEPVDITLTSVDVNHSFWVPELAGKVDLIPGKTNLIHIRADHPGTYRGLCAEFCGLQHAHMDFLVIADPPGLFRTWVADQAGDAPTDVAGEALFSRLTCAGCHTVRGTPADGTFGPDLTHLASRTTLGAVTVPNDREHLAEWVQHAQSLKRGSLMPDVDLSPDQLQAVLAYLEALK
ncbi:MAG TPA: cytochrome c oxidase subunit II [Acidimicrobiales bacterium]|nr:cytochrome c oxidase subunit II [Acidimicrobiales bacterium]